MTVRISVEPTRCRASQTCIRYAGDLFAFPDDSESAVARVEVVDDPALIELAREAAESCPTAAITVADVA